MSKKTKQGVLDLNHLKGKSVGRKVELPPPQPESRKDCPHPPEYEECTSDGCGVECILCGRTLDWNGKPY